MMNLKCRSYDHYFQALSYNEQIINSMSALVGNCHCDVAMTGDHHRMEQLLNLLLPGLSDKDLITSSMTVLSFSIWASS